MNNDQPNNLSKLCMLDLYVAQVMMGACFKDGYLSMMLKLIFVIELSASVAEWLRAWDTLTMF